MTTLKKLSDRTLLVILDGYGINKNQVKNAIKDAKTPNLDSLFSLYPFTTIEAGGESVGLPKGVIGNSEVGHMNLGAGKPIRQDLVRINESIENGSYSSQPKLIELIDTAKKNTKRIHLFGLLSDGGVHSHINHIKETILTLSKENDLEIYFHAFMDGRDTQQDVGGKYIEELLQTPGFTFASMQGRSIGMDRDRRWEKIKYCIDTFSGLGKISKVHPTEYLKSEYAAGRFDEFVEPILFDEKYKMKDGDCLFFLNFRPDRAIQLSLALNDPNFSEFKIAWKPAYFLCMTPYIPDEVKLPILFDKEKIEGGLSEYLSSKKIKQFKIAETEKYAHVTFFFNGGEKNPFEGEVHKLIPSPKEVSTYDQKPEMSAYEVTENLLTAMDDDFSFLLVNFANSDMVGHTGKYEAAVKAIEALDVCVGKLMKKCEEKSITLLLTADHGNSDQMVYEDGSPHTSHTGAPVPFCVFHPSLKGQNLERNTKASALKDVAPTVLYSLGIDFPPTFEGHQIFN